MKKITKNGINCRRIIILFFILVFVKVSFSQISNPKFSHLATCDAISQRAVFATLKDYKGFMWFATDEELNKYDFLEINLLTTKNSYSNNSLNNNLVLSITGDAANISWIGTDGGGFDRFDSHTHNFTLYKDDNGCKKRIFNNYVLSFAEYAPGILALGFHRGSIYLFDVKNNRFTRFAQQDLNSNRIASLTVNVLYKDTQQNFWVGTNDNGGLFLLDKKTRSLINFFHGINKNKSICGSIVFAMFETKAGQLWMSGDNGVDLFNSSTKKGRLLGICSG